MAVHVIGNTTEDQFFRVDSLPAPGETQLALRAFRDLGGKGANQAVAAVRVGANVDFYTALGSDSSGDWLNQTLTGEAFRALNVQKPVSESDQSFIFVDPAGENSIVSTNAAAGGLRIDDFKLNAAIGRQDHVLLQGNLAPAATRAVLDLASSKGAVTVLNASPVPAQAAELLRYTNVLIVNAGEACVLARISDSEVAAKRLSALGPADVLVTLGAGGAIWIRGNEARRFHARAVNAVDTTGAGDVFCGVFVGLVDRGKPFAQAIEVAMQAAGLATTRLGTYSSIPQFEEGRPC